MQESIEQQKGQRIEDFKKYQEEEFKRIQIEIREEGMLPREILDSTKAQLGIERAKAMQEDNEVEFQRT